MLKVEGVNETVSIRKGRPYWNCKCDCGKRVAVNHGRLMYDAVYSCGCSTRPRGKKRFYYVRRTNNPTTTRKNRNVARQSHQDSLGVEIKG